MHDKHATISQSAASHFATYLSNACSGYVFNAVSLRQSVYSSCLRTRLWLSHDAEVMFDGPPDDVRTIWQLERGFLLHEHDLCSKPHLRLTFSLPSHDLSVRRLKQSTFFSLSVLFKVLFTFLGFLFLPMNHGPSQQSSKEEYKPWK